MTQGPASRRAVLSGPRAAVTLAFAPVADGAAPREVAPADESALLGPRATPKRVAEFRAGRVAARAAIGLLLAREGVAPTGRVVIARDGGASDGRPRAVDEATGAALGVQVSISHVDGLALGVASRCLVGADLVTVEALGAALADEAFVPGERDAWAAFLATDPGDPRVACAAFAAKEAALKWWATGLRAPLQGVRVAPARAEPAAGGMVRFTATLTATVDGLRGAVLDGWYGVVSGKVVVVLAGD